MRRDKRYPRRDSGENTKTKRVRNNKSGKNPVRSTQDAENGRGTWRSGGRVLGLRVYRPTADKITPTGKPKAKAIKAADDCVTTKENTHKNSVTNLQRRHAKKEQIRRQKEGTQKRNTATRRNSTTGGSNQRHAKGPTRTTRDNGGRLGSIPTGNKRARFQ